MGPSLLSVGPAARRSRWGVRYLASVTVAPMALLAVGTFTWVELSSAAHVVVLRAAPTHDSSVSSCTSPSFGAATNFAVGIGPRSIAMSDFNKDGNPDLITANLNSDNVSVLLGNGSGNFGPATNFAVGAAPSSVAVGDFNRDGNPDFATANGLSTSNNIEVLLGNGSGGFGPPTNFADGSGPNAVAAADFNNDGNLDIAFTSIADVSILLGNGSGGFGDPTDFPVAGMASSVAVGDFNSDGNLDLVTGNYAVSHVSVLLGDGSGGFGATTYFAAGDAPVFTAVGDFNSDGNPDIAVANANSNNISVLLGNGSGSFGAPTNFEVGTNPYSVAVGDFNGDGILDLAAANLNLYFVSVLLGYGNGTFQSQIDFAVGEQPISVIAGDLNKDGSPDLAVANAYSGNVSVLLNTCGIDIVTPTASPIGTHLPTPTSTSTSTPTPPICPIQFTDVPGGSTFSRYVTCLVCRGIVSGYPCGGPGEPCNGNNEPYFRPNHNVTRGQIAKIVSNSAGFQDPVTQQSFEDVVPDSTFHEYVERLALRGVISGYPCGGAGEPCVGPQNRPYFRPDGYTSRAQLSKIVCRAYGCTGTVYNQTFEDVGPDSTFYLDIEQLHALGAIVGYPCGAMQEPCEAGNRPYFRPGNNVTRGQTTKIVSNTFFPNCSSPTKR